jgi:hypothetical protein
MMQNLKPNGGPEECIAFGMREETKCRSASGMGRRQIISRKECNYMCFSCARQEWDSPLYQNTRLIRDVPYLTNRHSKYQSLNSVRGGETPC